MKKITLFILPFISLVSGCNPKKDNSDSTELITTESETSMILYIDENEMNVSWLDNDSSKALKSIAPLTITMSRYGDFEQVGSIGQSIVSDNHQITTEPGDIVLYNSNNLVIFFGSNSWSYTKLGHIDLSQNELRNILDKESVTVEIKKEKINYVKVNKRMG